MSFVNKIIEEKLIMNRNVIFLSVIFLTACSGETTSPPFTGQAGSGTGSGATGATGASGGDYVSGTGAFQTGDTAGGTAEPGMDGGTAADTGASPDACLFNGYSISPGLLIGCGFGSPFSVTEAGPNEDSSSVVDAVPCNADSQCTDAGVGGKCINGECTGLAQCDMGQSICGSTCCPNNQCYYPTPCEGQCFGPWVCGPPVTDAQALDATILDAREEEAATVVNDYADVKVVDASDASAQ